MSPSNTYDEYADQYARMVAGKEGVHHTDYPVVAQMLAYMGDVQDLTVLDAGCGEGFFSRILAEQGARVTGIDVAPGLVEKARAQDVDRIITYQVANLSEPFVGYEAYFDLVISHLVLNDVSDYKGFIKTIGMVMKNGGRFVLSMNNPYSAVIRDKAGHYFDSDTSTLYQGLSTHGVKVYYYHRTLEEYITAFRENGFLLRNLCDVRPTEEQLISGNPVFQKHYHFPFFMILEWIKMV